MIQHRSVFFWNCCSTYCTAVLLYVAKVWSVGGWTVHCVVRGGWVRRSARVESVFVLWEMKPFFLLLKYRPPTGAWEYHRPYCCTLSSTTVRTAALPYCCPVIILFLVLRLHTEDDTAPFIVFFSAIPAGNRQTSGVPLVYVYIKRRPAHVVGSWGRCWWTFFRLCAVLCTANAGPEVL